MCYYDALIGITEPVVVEGDWLHIHVRNLTPGEFYVAPIFLWAPKTRPLKVEIYKAGSKSDIALRKEIKIGPQMDDKGNPTWIAKRYKLNSERHNGSAYMRLGYPNSKVPFNIYAEELTSKAIAKRKLRDQGKCPTCGKEGYWHCMAMICPEHGVYI